MNSLDFWATMSWPRAVFGSREMKGLNRGPRDSEARGWDMCKFSCPIMGASAETYDSSKHSVKLRQLDITLGSRGIYFTGRYYDLDHASPIESLNRRCLEVDSKMPEFDCEQPPEQMPYYVHPGHSFRNRARRPKSCPVRYFWALVRDTRIWTFPSTRLEQFEDINQVLVILVCSWFHPFVLGCQGDCHRFFEGEE